MFDKPILGTQMQAHIVINTCFWGAHNLETYYLNLPHLWKSIFPQMHKNVFTISTVALLFVHIQRLRWVIYRFAK